MGIQSLRSEDAQTAIRYFTQALSMQSNYPEAHLGLGLAYMSSGQFDKARQELEFLKQLSPDMAANLTALIQDHLSQDN
jgi:Flp pilus assembly protein TadD